MKLLKHFRKNYERRLGKRKFPVWYKLALALMWALSTFVLLNFIMEYPDVSAATAASLRLNNAIQSAACVFVIAFAAAFTREAIAFLYAMAMLVIEAAAGLAGKIKEKESEA